jgi:hypothetical protein
MTGWSPDEGSPEQVRGNLASTANRSVGIFLALLATYVVLLAGYVGLRYAWHGLDGDAVILTTLSQNVLAEATISPAGGAYQSGYAYPALNTFLAHLAGVPVGALQQLVQPFLVVLLIPASYAAYRSFTGRVRVTLLACLLLFLSPEFLFEATRSSHAKVTWLLALTMLFVLARSFRSDGSPRQLAILVVLFYLAAYALVSTNSFFASGYIFGITFAFAATRILSHLTWTRGIVTPGMRRLSYVTASSVLLVFLSVFYLYPPAMLQFRFLRSTVDQLSVFLLNVEPASATNPYAYLQATWLSTPVYLALTSFNWFILLVSFAVWLRQGWSLLVRQKSMPPQRVLLWLLYASFGVLMLISVIVDLAGALSANLQVRLFSHFLLVGIPLASEGVVAFMGWTQRGQSAVVRKVGPALLVMLISFFSLASMLKITNEPLLSNSWTFSVNRERLSVQWIGDHVRLNQVWLGREVRLQTLVKAYGDWLPRSIGIDRGATPASSRYVLVSDISRMRADRMETALPDTRGFQRIYDAGGTELYCSRPQTPYQR